MTITEQKQWNNFYINAAMKGEFELVRHLLEDYPDFADIHANNDDAILLACEEGHLDIVEYLLCSPRLKEHISITTRHNRLIQCACLNNDINMIQLLFEIGNDKPDISSKNFFAFTWLFKLGHLDTIEFLLDKTISKKYNLSLDIHMYNDICFKSAVVKNRRNVIEFLICQYNIVKTSHITNLLDNLTDFHLKRYIETLFERRDLYYKLNLEIISHHDTSYDDSVEKI